MILRLFVVWCALCFLMVCSGANANRQEEISSCWPHELATWGDGTDKPVKQRAFILVYRPTPNLPFNESTVRAVIERAALSWSECGLSIRMVDELGALAAPLSQRIVVRWMVRTQVGIAVADVNRGELILNQKVFETLVGRRGQALAQETLQMTLSHELGHFLGMRAHSRRCVDVMSYYTSASGEKCSLRDPTEFGRYLEYRHILPTACDIARCKALNDVR